MMKMTKLKQSIMHVTILILIDGFLQYKVAKKEGVSYNRSQSLF